MYIGNSSKTLTRPVSENEVWALEIHNPTHPAFVESEIRVNKSSAAAAV